MKLKLFNFLVKKEYILQTHNMKKTIFSTLLIFAMLSTFFFAMLVCPIHKCSTNDVGFESSPLNMRVYFEDSPPLKGTRRLISRPFNVSSGDTMIVLHIQKTGGTVFGRNLVQNLKLKRPCEFKGGNTYECKRPGSKEDWLYSRYSTGWICGPHAGYTELSTCMPNVLRKRRRPLHLNRVFYITWLRDPVERFLSEFGHVRRGATWKTVRHVCNGKEYNSPKCYHGINWSDVTLQRFLNCPYNLAFNRQTRMTADINQVGCYGDETNEKQKAILRSAKKNLRNLAFVGLVEFQKESQFVFEQTFGLKFGKSFEQKSRTFSKTMLSRLSPAVIRKIRLSNRLDMQLYDYAKEVFFQRLEYFKLLQSKKILAATRFLARLHRNKLS
ncbi:heparan-sulfate 6-O-sulfotransferase 1-B-like [Xenia sp. Carnegie-2017]|uniref:heparan-sulfate 6-O-sulfotransferase 1-B-like n=1 Tax=Xenia sp. Carnegie-2017 TaxID=2897299 RepID=UPI001F03E4A7|nr:heparan-sulfate 6-O-sulfotransferase 1-B-like [Xenia sp. Carnegie-2017]